MSIGQEEREAVLRVMDRGILSGFQGNWSDAFYGGPEIKALESEWADYFGVKHAITCNSATSGLWLACAAIGLGASDECIVSPYSMTCSASIPLHFGAKPVFADIEPDYYCLDPSSVEDAITERTKAIIVVDIFGQPCDADGINAIAEKYSKMYGHKIYVIEDAAQAIGAKYKGRYAGTLGDIGVYSLNRHKHIQCGEGGVVVTNNDELAFKIRLAMNHSEAVMNGIYNPRTLVTEEQCKNIPKDILEGRFSNIVGLNLRMTELQAAIAREQLKKLDGILKIVRYHAANSFNIDTKPYCDHAFYRYAWSDCKQSEFDYYLNRPEFEIKRHYIKPLYLMPLFTSLGYPNGLCPTCEEVDKNIVLAWLKVVP